MRKIYAIGESLIDIIFSQGDVKAARPGGSMLNSAVSLGRAGEHIIFLSEFGNDQGGNFIATFLENNGVKTHSIYRYSEGKTPLALAFLNDSGNASYDFYKPYPKDRLRIEIPAFTPNDIFLFGSFFGIDPTIRQTVLSMVQAARQSDVLVVYDPNFRKPHAHQLDSLRPLILENMSMASIIKASDEDMEIIFGESDPVKLRLIPEIGNKPLIITQGSKGALLNTPSMTEFIPAREVQVVSTIGAGDNFNAGLIYGIIKAGAGHRDLANLDSDQWKSVLQYAIEFAADVCKNYDNYISDDFAQKILQ
jgi:fructokinase